MLDLIIEAIAYFFVEILFEYTGAMLGWLFSGFKEGFKEYKAKSENRNRIFGVLAFVLLIALLGYLASK